MKFKTKGSPIFMSYISFESLLQTESVADKKNSWKTFTLGVYLWEKCTTPNGAKVYLGNYLLTTNRINVKLWSNTSLTKVQI